MAQARWMARLRSYRARHVLPTAHRRLDLAVAIGATGNGHRTAAVQGQSVVDQFGVTVSAGDGTDAHATFVAGIDSHGGPLLKVGQDS